MFWCTADIGWVTGHSYMAYGRWRQVQPRSSLKASHLPERRALFWQMIERHRCTVFYTRATAIRSLIRLPKPMKSRAPRTGTCPPCASWVRWASHQLKPGCGITSTWAASVAPSWTPSGKRKLAVTSMTPLPGATPLVPGSCTLPLPGIMAAIVDEAGNDMPNGAGGILVVKRPGRR